MKESDARAPTVVIGGGFFGSCLALLLRGTRRRVVLVERESALLQRASLRNQARVHAGYHYPRSLLTAVRSLVNFPRFLLDFRECIDDDFSQVYAIARMQSKVSARQFQRLFESMGAPIRRAPDRVRGLFNPSLIEDAFIVTEHAFDAVRLRHLLEDRLRRNEVEVRCSTEVTRIAQAEGDGLSIELSDGSLLDAATAFLCTYSQINTLLHQSGLPLLPMKQEITEIALIEPPPALAGLGVTVMDGPFFSTMPYPPARVHSLSHVRYTPHCAWNDLTDYENPEDRLVSVARRSNFPFMLRDSCRFLPELKDARYAGSLFETKTVLLQNEIDDGRPILFRRDCGLRNLTVVMGGKIDNVYDVMQILQSLHGLGSLHGYPV